MANRTPVAKLAGGAAFRGTRLEVLALKQNLIGESEFPSPNLCDGRTETGWGKPFP